MAKRIVQLTLNPAYDVEAATIHDGKLYIEIDASVSAAMRDMLKLDPGYAQLLTDEGFDITAISEALLQTLLRATVLLP